MFGAYTNKLGWGIMRNLLVYVGLNATMLLFAIIIIRFVGPPMLDNLDVNPIAWLLIFMYAVNVAYLKLAPYGKIKHDIVRAYLMILLGVTYLLIINILVRPAHDIANGAHILGLLAIFVIIERGIWKMLTKH